MVIASAIALVPVMFFFLTPVVPYTFSSSNFGIYSGQVSAPVSPSFHILADRVVFNPTQTGSAPGITVSHKIYSGGEWECG